MAGAHPDLSLVIPAYNESARLPRYLRRIRAYLESTFGGSYEVLVVDDGSQDGLASILECLQSGWPQLSFVRHLENQGKGAAVREGMLATRGDLLLFADADGATPIEEERSLRQALRAGAEVAVGSRLMGGAAPKPDRSWHRDLSGRLFAWATQRWFRLPVRDTQCGFKMFQRESGLRLFRLCRERGFLFDIELLSWANRLRYRIAEVPVAWKDMPGSKVRLVRDGWGMLRGLWNLRFSLHAGTENHMLDAGTTWHIPVGGPERPVRR